MKRAERRGLFANRFEIEGVAGSGGMGTVYRARDRSSGQAVALKVREAATGDEQDGERFAREARILCELQHPAIVSYVAHGKTLDGTCFLAMEWLDGQDLAQRLAHRRLSVGESLLAVSRVAAALTAAHGQGIIHRDLKPSNLFLPGGEIARLKLLDFGIARFDAAATAMTRTGRVLGTPAYMAPEQARGARELTPAADVFSLGCVLYECLTGRPPFMAEQIAAVLTRILFDEPAFVDVPARLVTLLGHMLEKDPARRIADAAELARHLSDLGELPDARRPQGARAEAPFADSEQVLFSLVVAVGPRCADAADTMERGDAEVEVSRRESLLCSIRAVGMRADFLFDGTLVATTPQMDSAGDQASLAARVGLLIKARWPEAVVAAATGRGSMQGTGAVGEVADRAARLLHERTREPQGTNAQGESGVWLDELSARLLGPRFVVTTTNRGVQVLGQVREFDASRPLLGKPTPCVGRDAELGALEAHLRGSIDDCQARVILVTGAPGVGKSRLRHEFLRNMERNGEPLTVLTGRGDAMSAGSPYGILADAIRRLCGLGGGESLDEIRSRLSTRLARHVAPPDQHRVVHFVGELCGAAFPDEEGVMLQAARQDPKMMREALRRATLDWLRAECAANPLVVLLDDLQWGDLLSVSLLDEALRDLRESPLFLLAFARPEVHKTFSRLWERHGLQQIPLKGLSARACTRLVQLVLGDNVARACAVRVSEQSAGNALFIEELIRQVAEGNPGDHPETLTAMLQVRIGRLDAGARRAVRAASVFGHTFRRTGVEAVLELPTGSPAVERWLSALVAAELIAGRESSHLADDEEYAFRHVLVRDAAYSLLTPNDRSTGHRLVGTFLEQHGGDAWAIATHFQLGGSSTKALAWFRRAAEQALPGGDTDRVIACAERASACTANGPTEVRAGLRALEGEARAWRGELALAETCSLEALQGLEHGSPAWYQAAFGALMLSTQLGNFERIARYIELLIAEEPRDDAAAPEARAWFFVLRLMVTVGDVATANVFRDRLEKLEPRIREDSCAIPWVYCARGYCSTYVEWDPASALTSYLAELPHFERTGDVVNHRITRAHVGWVLQWFGAYEESERTLAAVAAEPDGTGFIHDFSRLYLGRTLALLGRHDEARVLEQAVGASFISAQNHLFAGLAHVHLAEIETLAGKAEAAASSAATAADMLKTAPPLRASALGWTARARLALGDAAGALVAAQEAVAITDGLGVFFEGEIRLRVTLADALEGVGRRAEARLALQQVRDRLETLAASISASEYRVGFVERIPENARVLGLSPASSDRSAPPGA